MIHLLRAFFLYTLFLSVAYSAEKLVVDFFRSSIQKDNALLDRLSLKAFNHLTQSLKDPKKLIFEDKSPLLSAIRPFYHISSYQISEITPYVKDQPYALKGKRYYITISKSEYKKWSKLFIQCLSKEKMIWKGWQLVDFKETFVKKQPLSILCLKPGPSMSVGKVVFIIATNDHH